MPAEENKVKFGLKNAHFANFTIGESGEVTFDDPVKLPGSVELSLEPTGDMIKFYADDMLYYSAPNNQGYEGTLTIARITDAFAQNCLGEIIDPVSKTLVEDADAKPKAFALLFEFDGDKSATRHVVYNCQANRPTVAGATKTDSTEPNTAELSFSSTPMEVGGKRIVKTRTSKDTPAETFNSWYQTVFVPTFEESTGDSGDDTPPVEETEPEGA